MQTRRDLFRQICAAVAAPASVALASVAAPLETSGIAIHRRGRAESYYPPAQTVDQQLRRAARAHARPSAPRARCHEPGPRAIRGAGGAARSGVGVFRRLEPQLSGRGACAPGQLHHGVLPLASSGRAGLGGERDGALARARAALLQAGVARRLARRRRGQFRGRRDPLRAGVRSGARQAAGALRLPGVVLGRENKRARLIFGALLGSGAVRDTSEYSAFWRGFESVQTLAAGSAVDRKRRAAGSAKLGVAHGFSDRTNGFVGLNGQLLHDNYFRRPACRPARTAGSVWAALALAFFRALLSSVITREWSRRQLFSVRAPRGAPAAARNARRAGRS